MRSRAVGIVAELALDSRNVQIRGHAAVMPWNIIHTLSDHCAACIPNLLRVESRIEQKRLTHIKINGDAKRFGQAFVVDDDQLAPNPL